MKIMFRDPGSPGGFPAEPAPLRTVQSADRTV